jgi:hypothetical protein
VLNLCVAAAVWLLAAGVVVGVTAAPGAPAATRQPPGAGPRTLLLVSLATGTASFIYEIGWIRMLSLVLGSSTHSFELMVSARA